MRFESDIEVYIWEGDTVHAQKFWSDNATVVPLCGSDLGRDTKSLAQNIIVFVVTTLFFSRKHSLKDHGGHIELVQLCIKWRL